MAKEKCALQFAVLGLGRFGMSVVKTLAEHDVELLACDKNAALVHEAAEYVTHAVQADVADEEAMRKLGLGNFDVVVLAIGEDFEASVLAAMTAKELGAGHIVSKADGLRQKKILESVGVNRVVLPEAEMGMRVARGLVDKKLVDVLDQTDRYTITETHPRDEWVGKSVREADIRNRYGVSLLAVVRGDETVIPVMPDEILRADDVLVAFTTNEGGKGSDGK